MQAVCRKDVRAFMIEKMPINLKLLLTLSQEIFTEERAGVIYECRKLKEEGDESYEIRKKRAAMSVILAKIQRIDNKD